MRPASSSLVVGHSAHGGRLAQAPPTVWVSRRARMRVDYVDAVAVEVLPEGAMRLYLAIYRYRERPGVGLHVIA